MTTHFIYLGDGRSKGKKKKKQPVIQLKRDKKGVYILIGKKKKYLTLKQLRGILLLKRRAKKGVKLPVEKKEEESTIEEKRRYTEKYAKHATLDKNLKREMENIRRLVEEQRAPKGVEREIRKLEEDSADKEAKMKEAQAKIEKIQAETKAKEDAQKEKDSLIYHIVESKYYKTEGGKKRAIQSLKNKSLPELEKIADKVDILVEKEFEKRALPKPIERKQKEVKEPLPPESSAEREYAISYIYQFQLDHGEPVPIDYLDSLSDKQIEKLYESALNQTEEENAQIEEEKKAMETELIPKLKAVETNALKQVKKRLQIKRDDRRLAKREKKSKGQEKELDRERLEQERIRQEEQGRLSEQARLEQERMQKEQADIEEATRVKTEKANKFAQDLSSEIDTFRKERGRAPTKSEAKDISNRLLGIAPKKEDDSELLAQISNLEKKSAPYVQPTPPVSSAVASAPPPPPNPAIQKKRDALYAYANRESNQELADRIYEMPEAEIVSLYNQKVSEGRIKGSGDSGEGLTDAQIDQILNKYPGYKGSFLSEELPKHIPDFKPDQISFCVLLINYNKEKTDGHWVALYIDPVKDMCICYYDPLADPIPADIQANLQKLVQHVKPDTYLKLKTNDIASGGIKEQSEKSDNCGWFSARFLIDMLRGKGFPQASGYSDVHKNEKAIESFKKKFPYISGSGIVGGWSRQSNTIPTPVLSRETAPLAGGRAIEPPGEGFNIEGNNLTNHLRLQALRELIRRRGNMRNRIFGDIIRNIGVVRPPPPPPPPSSLQNDEEEAEMIRNMPRSTFVRRGE